MAANPLWRIIRRLQQRVVGIPRWESVVSVVSGGAFAFYKWYFEGTFAFSDLSSVLIPCSLAAIVLSLLLVIESAYDVRKEDIEDWRRWTPAIPENTFRPPKPPRFPIIGSAALCSLVPIGVLCAVLIAVPHVPNPKLSVVAPRPPATLRSTTDHPLELALTPHVLLLRRDRNPADGVNLVSYYGFSAVLHVYNAGPESRQIRQLEISGENDADRQDDVFNALETDGKTMDEIEQEALKRRPFKKISLLALPIGESRVEAHDGERFIKFRFLEPTPPGIQVFLGQMKDYYGFRSEGKKPRRVTTSPNVFDVVRFSGISDLEPREFQQPTLRPEFHSGKLGFHVLVGSSRVKVDAAKINRVQMTPLSNWSDGNPADLFYGLQGNYYDRLGSPR